MPFFLANPLVVFTLTMFASATLLFFIEPMIGKMILPRFGGTPAVWNTCMVFFQAALLAGYAYAHVLTTRFPLRKQVTIHMVLLIVPLVAFLVFPLGIAAGVEPPGDSYPAFWVLLVLMQLVGLPFFVVSTSAPLLQRWFGSTGHWSSKDPYFLYAASNLGSMVALIAYPAVMEPYLRLMHQGIFWMVGYALLVGLTVYCGLMVYRTTPATAPVIKDPEPEAAPVPAVAAAVLATDPSASAAITEEEDTGSEAEDEPAIAPGGKGSKRSRKAKKAAKAALKQTSRREPEAPVKAEPPRATAPQTPSANGEAARRFDREEAPSLVQQLHWVALAFVPSSLMLGVTVYLTTDIAAIPLLWIIPLAIYLISFIVVFSKIDEAIKKVARLIAGPEIILDEKTKKKPAGDWTVQLNTGFNTMIWTMANAGVHGLMVLSMPVIVLLLVFLIVSPGGVRIEYKFLLHLLALFIVAMVCHGELARTRPATKYLTGFFLAMSLGGVLGGLFNALLAPLIFKTVAEYQLVMAIACMLLPPPPETKSTMNMWIDRCLAGGLILASLYAVWKWVGIYDWQALASVPLLWHYLLNVLSLNDNLMSIVLMAGLVAGLGAYVVYRKRNWQERLLDMVLPLALCLLTVELIARSPFEKWSFDTGPFPWLKTTFNITQERLAQVFTYGLPVALCYGFAEQPIRFGLGVGAILLAAAFHGETRPPLHLERSFFGVLKVEDAGRYHRLLHGTTLHGMQRMPPRDPGPSFPYCLLTLGAGSPLEAVAMQPGIQDMEEAAEIQRFNSLAIPLSLKFALTPLIASNPLEAAVATVVGQKEALDRRPEALTYYHRTGPVGLAYEAALSGPDATRDVAFIGLGTGTMASYLIPGQRGTFFEIDPAVVRISSNPEYFTYLRDCLGEYRFDMGDARLRMRDPKYDGKFKFIVVDAFSSDAIPIHLITKEAIEMYFRKLATDGVLAVHISNRHLDLGPVLGNIVEHLGLFALQLYDKDEGHPGKNTSDWVLIARHRNVIESLTNDSRWERLKPDPSRTLWTDDFSNILEIYRWR